ncbi:MAG: EAL domain-containing protein [Burkholderiales bacterium]|nr:EAL domain-containing protein [Burkholderiales bacterium]
MVDELLALKWVKLGVVGAITLALLWMSQRQPAIARHRGWTMIIIGLVIVGFGDALNIYTATPAGQALASAHVLDLVRYSAWTLGNVLLAVGFWHWLPLVVAIKEAKEELKQANDLLESQVVQRTAELKSANNKLHHDLEERKRVEQSIRHMAHHDALTGLPNRALFRDRLTHAMAQADRYHQKLAVMFLDLDRFKAINDTLGHNVGDQLLKIAAERLRSCVRDCDTVARLGGDEFTVVVEDIIEDHDAASVAQKILDTLSQPFNLYGHEVFISVSVGVTLYPSDDENADNLLRNADSAMYRAKENGRNNFQFYVADMNVKARERLMLESSLRRALDRGEFRLYYQPRVDLLSGRVIGAEALLRWRHPEMGLVPPAEFIPILDETGMIIPVGDWALREACRQNREWQDMGLPPIRVAVNLSVRQFIQKDLADTVIRALEVAGLAAKHLELEITEDLFLEHNETNIVTLARLKGMGIHISIDDFGTGYSSLSYLKRLPIDTLKIDQSFVRDIGTDPDNKAIASAIIAMASSLRLNVLAEGVETDEQLAFLRAQGCNEIQGFSFSHPLPAEEFEQLLREGRQMRLLQGLSGYYVNTVSSPPLTH